MPAPLQDLVPTLFRAGDTIQFLRSFNDYPASDGWTYTIYWNGPSAKFQAVGQVSPSGQGWKVVVAAGVSNVAAGIYRYSEVVTFTGKSGTQQSASRTIPSSSPYTVSVPNFVTDLDDVTDAAGNQLQQAASSPETGQYTNDNSGNYTFNAAYAGQTVSITYESTGTGPDTGETHTIGEGVSEIMVNLATAAPGAMLSFAEQTLNAIEAAITARIAGNVEEYHFAIGGSSWSSRKMTMEQLVALRGKYASIVWRQKNPGKIGADIYVDFVDETNDAQYPSTWVDVTGLPGAGQ